MFDAEIKAAQKKHGKKWDGTIEVAKEQFEKIQKKEGRYLTDKTSELKILEKPGNLRLKDITANDYTAAADVYQAMNTSINKQTQLAALRNPITARFVLQKMMGKQFEFFDEGK